MTVVGYPFPLHNFLNTWSWVSRVYLIKLFAYQAYWPTRVALEGKQNTCLLIDRKQSPAWDEKGAVIMIVHGKLAAKGSPCDCGTAIEAWGLPAVLLLSANLAQHACRAHRGVLHTQSSKLTEAFHSDSPPPPTCSLGKHLFTDEGLQHMWIYQIYKKCSRIQGEVAHFKEVDIECTFFLLQKELPMTLDCSIPEETEPITAEEREELKVSGELMWWGPWSLFSCNEKSWMNAGLCWLEGVLVTVSPPEPLSESFSRIISLLSYLWFPVIVRKS